MKKYKGFHESFFAKVWVYNLPWNFSALKLSWYAVVIHQYDNLLIIWLTDILIQVMADTDNRSDV